jgi:hypothetical protein
MIRQSLETTSIRCDKCEITFVFYKGKEGNPCPHLVDWWKSIPIAKSLNSLVGKWRTDTGHLVQIDKWNEQTGYYEGRGGQKADVKLTFDYQGLCLNFPELVGKVVTRQRGEEVI